MSEVKLNKKEKFTKGRNEERNNKFKGNGERRTFKKDGGGDDDKRGNGEGRSFDLKRKRVYGERGVEKEGENSNGRVPKWKSLPRKDGFRKKSGVNDDVSDFDRLNRLKFSSGKGGNVQKGEFNEEKGRKKDGESWRGYKGKTGVKVEGKRFSGRVGKEEGVASNLRSRTETRDRWVSSKRSEEVGFDGKRNFEGKSYSGRGKERVGSGEGSESKFKSKVETRDRWISTKRREDEVSDSKLKSRPKTNDRRVIVKQDDVPDGLQKTYSRKKIDSNRQADQKPSNRHGVEPPGNSMKKMLRSKKDAVKNSEWEDGPPKKKKKKVMRIDPQDISNKRLDDSIPVSGTTVEKEVDPDKENEISKNAQFRAIQPSPSILSFVEDNLLGRRRSIELRRAGYNIDFSAPLDNIPLSTSSERERIEEAVFRNKLEFFAAAKISSSFPPAELPEIAFAGRSNVGKSSLLNALTRQWGVVRTSDKPGLTQTINFFKLGPKLSMVDLPGYGFAYAKEEVKDAWEELVKEYVSTRVGLKRVCLLIDTKWGMKPRDHELINLMERSQTKYQIVLTKSDLVFPIDVARRAMQIEETLKANKSLVQPVMMASAKSGAGIRSLRTALAKIARLTKL